MLGLALRGGLVAAEALANADVVALTEAGLGRRALVVKIETSATAFDTSVAELVALSRAGMADEDV